MANNSKKYASLSTLQNLVDNIKSLFVSKESFTKANIGLGNVDNTADANKTVKHAATADSSSSATKAMQDGNGEIISSTYETKTDASAKLTEAKTYTDTKTANLTSDTVVNNKVNSHNTSTSSHSDIRDLISGLTTRLNTLANSDDTTLDQMSEIVAYIKNNKSLIDGVTTSKVNVSDIVNNLTTSSDNKPLSAAQGVAIKALIDSLQEELDGHGHEIEDIGGLTTTLANKAEKNHGTHVVYLVANPLMDGTASAGSANEVARADHRHPTDTSRASKTEFDSHDSNTTKHITATERTNWNAAKTHADSAHAPSNAQPNQNAFSNIKVGSTTIAADTTTDTLELVGSNVTITPDTTNDKVTIAVANGSTSAKGIVQLTNSTSSTSTTTAATPNSVKLAYDLANNAYALADSKADSLSDLGVTSSVAELNHMDGVISNVQTQLDERHTHWIECGSDTILPSRSLSNNAILSGLTNVTPPDCIVVTFDNIEYKCVMWTNSDGENCYGDSRITTMYDEGAETLVTDMTNPENTPFYINACADDGADFSLVWTWHIVFNSDISSTSHTVKINEAEYHTISENFIPDTIARKSAVSQVQIITWEAND